MTIFNFKPPIQGKYANAGLVVFAASCLLLVSACKRDEELVYNNAPLDPMCVLAAAEPGGVELDNCTGSAGKTADTEPENGLETFADGSTGYTFKCEGGCMRPPFVSYKNMGKLPDNEFVLKVESSGGGTGVFSDVRTVRIENNLLLQKVVNGGDRCNGGIANVNVRKNRLSYGQNITPFDLVELSNGNQAGFKAYDDISACAACCIGVAEYEGEELVGVTLSADAVDDAAGEGYTPADTCFYGAYNDVVRSGRKRLDKAELAEFGESFSSRCSDLKSQPMAGL